MPHSVLRLGTPVFPKKYFALLQQDLRRRLRSAHRSTPATAAWSAACCQFYLRDEVVPYYGGGMDLAREVAGNDFMYWDLMQAAAARGCRLFDFGRSKLGTGAYDFKKNWGFEPRRCTTSTSCTPRCAAGQQSAEPEVPAVHQDVEEAAAAGGELARPVHRAQPGLTTWQDLLLLIHRIPYPPNKGDKIRSYHLLKHLAQRLPRAPGDVRRRCRRLAARADGAGAVRQQPFRAARTRCARACAACGAARPTARCRSTTTATPAWQRWVDQTVAAQHDRRASWCSRRRWRSTPTSCGACAPRGRLLSTSIPTSGASTPTQKSLADELAVPRAKRASCCATSARSRSEFDASLFVSAPEADLFRELAPESAAAIGHFSNGVDTEYFSPERASRQPVRGRRTRASSSPARWTTGRTSTRCSGSRDEVLPALRAQRSGAALLHRRRAPDAGGAGAGAAARRDRHRHRARRAAVSRATLPWRWRRCASRAASRTRCSRRWPWPRRWWSRRRRSKASMRAPGSDCCWPTAPPTSSRAVAALLSRRTNRPRHAAAPHARGSNSTIVGHATWPASSERLECT